MPGHLWKLRTCLIGLTIVALIGLAQAAEPRTWSDRSGRNKIKAKMVGFQNGVVVLEREDGTRVSIPSAKLSLADQKYVQKEMAEYRKSNPVNPGDNPFESPGGPGAPGAPGTPGEPPDEMPGAPGRGAPGRGVPGRSAPPGGGPVEGSPAAPGRGAPGGGSVEEMPAAPAPGRSAPGRGAPSPLGEAESGRPTGGAFEGEGMRRPSQPATPPPPSEGSEDPFAEPGAPTPAPTPGAGRTEPAKPKANPESAKPGVTAVSAQWTQATSGANILGLGNVRDSWPLESGPVVKPASAASGDPIALPPGDFFDKFTGLAVSAPSNRAVVGRVTGRPGDKDKVSYFYVCDLAEGKRTKDTRVPGSYAPMSLSDDGNTLVVGLRVEPFGKVEELELWSVEGKFQRLARFTPYAEAQENYRDVKTALFAGPERLATVSSEGLFVLWDNATGEPVVQISGAREAVPAVSPDRRHLAVLTDKECALIDLTTNKAVAVIAGSFSGFGMAAFSPDGRHLAITNHSFLRVYSLQTGELVQELSGVIAFGRDFQMHFPDPDHVFAAETVYSVKHKMPVWAYSGGELYRAGGEYSYALAADRGRNSVSALVPILMPPARAVKQLDDAVASPDFVILKKGDALKIDTSGIDDPLRQSPIRLKLAERVEAAGYRVADDAKLTLKASSGFSPEVEMQYRNFGMPLGRFGQPNEPAKYKVRPFYARLQIDYNGKPAYQTGFGGSPPMFLSLQEGETIESALAKYSKPNYDFFGQVNLPERVTKPLGDGMGALGRSQVTAAGAR